MITDKRVSKAEYLKNIQYATRYLRIKKKIIDYKVSSDSLYITVLLRNKETATYNLIPKVVMRFANSYKKMEGHKMQELNKILDRINKHMNQALITNDEKTIEAFTELQRGIKEVLSWDLNYPVTKQDLENAFFSEYDKDYLLIGKDIFEDYRDIQHELVTFFIDYFSNN